MRIQGLTPAHRHMPQRPFYTDYAWAYDLLIDRPVRRECATIAGWLTERRVLPGAEVLDAGCGTGRFTVELARRGYLVHGIDLSPDLIDVARRTPDLPANVAFDVGDLLALPGDCCAGVLCRGVLNDLVDDEQRDAAFASFARALRRNGALVLDVREWHASAERKAREPLFRKRVTTDRGTLTFTSITTLDAPARRLLVSERHVLSRADGDAERESEYDFVMRCWERGELDRLLARHGFGDTVYFGAYDDGIASGTTDRLVVISTRG
jgi:SAM-dependent methyltransferase